MEGDGGLGALFLIVEMPDELAGVFPFPAGVFYLLEAEFFDLAGELAQLGEFFAGGGIALVDGAVEREAEFADAGEQLDPGKEEPPGGGGGSDPDFAAEEIPGEAGGGEHGDSSEAAECRMLEGRIGRRPGRGLRK